MKRHSLQTLDEDEFVAFYYSLLERPEIDKLFATYTKESPEKMSPNALLQFLQNEQKDGATVIEECQEIIKYVPNLQVYFLLTSSSGTLNRLRTRHTSVLKDLCIFSHSATCR